MKQKLIIFSIGMILTLAIRAQEHETFLTSKLTSGYPVILEHFIDSSHIITSYTYLNTGIDTLSVLFGESNFEGHECYWISIFSKDKFICFTSSHLFKYGESEFPSQDLDIEFDHYSKQISVHVMHNTSTNEIEYNWKNNNQNSKIASIQKIEKPLQKNKLLPNMKVVSLNGDSISIKDFMGKYVVINWWATTCAPCRQEIPGLNTLAEKYKSNSEVVFIAIALNKKADLEKYLKLNEFKYIQTISDLETSKLFGGSMPKNLIVDPKGVISYYSEGGNVNMAIDKELERQIMK